MLDLDIPIVPVRGQMWSTAPVPPRVFHTIAAAESALGVVIAIAAARRPISRIVTAGA